MTPRKEQILKSIIEAYSRTAEPIGSLGLSQEFELSPATIRAEMAELEAAGYISHPHTSAGRIPTDKGYRYYVNGLQDIEGQSRTKEAMAKRVAGAGDRQRAIRQATDMLGDLTKNLALATWGDGFYLSGLAGLFAQPEFHNVARAYEMARLLDSLEEWLQEASPAGRLNVYIGGENPIGRASGATLVLSRFSSPESDANYIGIVGPTRQSYSRVLSLVGYAGQLLEESLND